MITFISMGFNCLKTTEPLRGDNLPLSSQEFFQKHLINLGWMKG